MPIKNFEIFVSENAVANPNVKLVRNKEQSFTINDWCVYCETPDGEEEDFNNGEIYDVVANGIVVGNMCISYDGTEIKALEIKKQFRGKGYGADAVSVAIQEHQTINYVSALPTAKPFWEKQGFKVTGYKDYSDEYDMVR